VLAVLLLHANEVVSADRLVEEVWGGAPPEDAALYTQISRLRKVLEPDRDGGEPAILLTRAPGYMLRVEVEQLDLGRFEALVARAHRVLAAGEAQEASGLLREALGLWRGRPLADLEGEPFHHDAVTWLDDAWLGALEARVEADLACGRHAELVTELRTLVRSHPYRERLRGQLMLALYRSGRQAEALAAFDEGRRTLAADLGLEPSRPLRELQDSMLRQDPVLDAPAVPGAGGAVPARTPEDRPGAPRSARRRTALIAAAVAALALVAVALLVDRSSEDDTRSAASAGGSVAVLDARTGAIRGRVPLGTTPAAVATGEGGAWVVDADEQTVSRIDADDHAVTTFGTGSTPTDVAIGEGAVWVGSAGRVTGAQSAAAVATAVARVDPGTRTVRARIALPEPTRALDHATDGQLAVGAGAVWAIAPDGAVARIDPRTDAVTAVARGIQARAVAAGREGVWVLGQNGAIARLDPDRAEIEQRARIGASSVASLALGAGSAWVTAPGDGTLWRIQPGRRLVMRTIDVGAGATDVAFGDGALWVANPVRGEVVRVDPARNAVTARVGLGGTPRSVSVGDGVVWAASSAGAAATPRAGAAALPRSTCGPLVTGGGGAPDRVVVADLPLQGGLRFSTQQMEQAMLFTLRERRFRAGRFRIGFQSCDDSIARTGLFDEAKCRDNARMYARTRSVVGVVGLVNTPCALAAVPELNGAQGGPLGAVSALASYPGLTRRLPGAPPGELASLYPTGRRSFVRVIPADDYEAAAYAKLAAEDGARRVAALDDGDPRYGGMLADRFAAAARERGLSVVVRARWNPQGRGFERLARRVARERPDAIFLGGLLDTRGADVVRALRARLGEDVRLLAPSGFTPTSAFADAGGPAAEGAYVSLAGVIVESLGPAGRRFVARFGATQPGVDVAPSAIYAAESIAVMLDAVGASDGTRGSVVERLFATRRPRSLLGDLSFDRNGEPRSAPVTVLRIRRGARRLPDLPDAVLDRVVE